MNKKYDLIAEINEEITNIRNNIYYYTVEDNQPEKVNYYKNLLAIYENMYNKIV